MFHQRPGQTFFQDNGGPHVACLTRAFLANNNVNTLSFTEYSRDCNPIERGIATQ